jgi:hypothetical protein
MNLFILESFRLCLPAAWLSCANRLFLVAQYNSRSQYLRRVLRVIVSGLSIPWSEWMEQNCLRMYFHAIMHRCEKHLSSSGKAKSRW